MWTKAEDRTWRCARGPWGGVLGQTGLAGVGRAFLGLRGGRARLVAASRASSAAERLRGPRRFTLQPMEQKEASPRTALSPSFLATAVLLRLPKKEAGTLDFYRKSHFKCRDE